MPVRNTALGWGILARLLHWAMAVIIVFLLVVGVYMTDFVTDIYEQFELVQTHKSWGFTVFVLAIIRVVWRVLNPTPPMPDGMKGWERFAAHAGHYALYGFMFALPLSGWLMSSASTLQDLYGIQNKVFGLFVMPDPFQPGDKELEELFHFVHWACGIGLAITLLLHVGAALKHHFINRDTVLTRMIRGR